MTADAGKIAEVAVAGGWSWTTIAVALLNVLVGGAIGVWLKTRPKMRELEQSGQDKLIADLMRQNAVLAARLEKVERKLDEERATHEAMTALLRHRLNNSDQCLDALLLLLETAPDRVADAVFRIKDMRERHRKAETLEKAAMQRGGLAATAGATPPQ